MKSATEIVRLFKAHGFTLARDKNHGIWRCPCGHAQLTVGKTVGGGRGDTNAAVRIRRTARQCQQRMEENSK